MRTMKAQATESAGVGAPGLTSVDARILLKTLRVVITGHGAY